MNDKVLHRMLEQRMKTFYDEYFEKPPENEFEIFLPAGRDAFPVLLDCLTNGYSDARVRTDALIGLGRIFQAHGPTSDSLDTVVQHAKKLAPTGLTSERQACLFAIGCSGVASLINGFFELLDSEKPDAVNVACYVMGYACWEEAQPRIEAIMGQRNSETMHAATWAMGNIGNEAAVRSLVGLLADDSYVGIGVDALGNTCSIDAMKPLCEALTHNEMRVRLGAICGVRSIIGEHKEFLLGGDYRWLCDALRMASYDEVRVVAVFALLSLAELGQDIDRKHACSIMAISS